MNLSALFVDAILGLFVGFGIFTLTTVFIHFRNDKRANVLNGLINSSTEIIRLTAVAYLVMWLTNLYSAYQTQDPYIFLNRMTGPYWFGYWIYPFCYGLVPQLLWVKKFKQMKVVRLITALLLLFGVYLEKIIIWITSFHRDYVPSSWSMIPRYFLYDWFVNFVLFSAVLGVVVLLKNKLNREKN